jgi:hypothetical protein
LKEESVSQKLVLEVKKSKYASPRDETCPYF